MVNQPIGIMVEKHEITHLVAIFSVTMIGIYLKSYIFIAKYSYHFLKVAIMLEPSNPMANAKKRF